MNKNVKIKICLDMKVILDTNIYISAILFGGKPEMLIQLAREK